VFFLLYRSCRLSPRAPSTSSIASTEACWIPLYKVSPSFGPGSCVPWVLPTPPTSPTVDAVSLRARAQIRETGEWAGRSYFLAVCRVIHEDPEIARILSDDSTLTLDAGPSALNTRVDFGKDVPPEWWVKVGALWNRQMKIAGVRVGEMGADGARVTRPPCKFQCTPGGCFEEKAYGVCDFNHDQQYFEYCTDAKNNPRTCEGCWNYTAQRCAGCRSRAKATFYCSKQCQKMCRKQHKLVCGD
jgi:hypothetical protein